MMRAFFGVLMILAAAPAATAASFVAGAAGDEAEIRAILTSKDEGGSGHHRAPDLDWENAFGIRYTDLAKHEAFYGANVTPLQAASTKSLLEIKIRFVDPTLAVADIYERRIGQLDLATQKPGPDRWLRTTEIFKKTDGVWTEILQRVADLRLPYYKHYDAIPAAFPVPAATLAAYAGAYETAEGKTIGTVSVAGDHLVFVTPRHTYVVVPTSAVSFLSFRPEDLAEYDKITFGEDPDGRVTLALVDMVDEPVVTARKAR